jgi:hypothetical protein
MQIYGAEVQSSRQRCGAAPAATCKNRSFCWGAYGDEVLAAGRVFMAR